MARLVAHRLLMIVPVLLVVSFGVTSLVHLIPGDAATSLAGGQDASIEKIEQIREQFNLDDPALVQYWSWATSAVQGDFGDSLRSGRPIMDTLPGRIGVTAQLVALTFAFVLVIVVIVGAASSLWPGGWLDRSIYALTNVGIAAPAFLIGIGMIVLFAVRFKILPPFGYVPFTSGPGEWLRHMVMPAAALAALPGAMVARQLQGGVSDTMQAPFVRTAWAKGGTTSRVMARHVVRNSAMPAVTVLGLQVGVLLGGAVITERIFNLPGLGTYMLDGINYQDLPVIQAVAVFFVAARMLVNLAVDVSYGLLDPRVRP
jgi:peptide/nickel transport system permease protein